MNNKLERELNKVQNDLRSKIKLNNTFSPEEVALVAGVDLEYWTENVTAEDLYNYIDSEDYMDVAEFASEEENEQKQ